jgi:hypothetical protein
VSGWAIRPRGEYPADWPAIAKAVKDAAGWCCIRCGHPHEVSTAHVLTVHHLNGDKADGRWWNLLALCQRCHLSIQGRVAPEQAYLHPHTPWFRPYAAGFYGATILGVELTREQVEEYVDALLIVGQPWLEHPPGILAKMDRLAYLIRQLRDEPMTTLGGIPVHVDADVPYGVVRLVGEHETVELDLRAPTSRRTN